MGKIKGLLVEPYKLPYEINIENTLEEKQKLVGGYIECTYLMDDDEVVLICNEEGKMLGMDLNRDIGHDIIAGPFLILGDNQDSGDFESLTQKQINKYKKVFDEQSIENTQKRVINILKNRKNERGDR